MFDVVACEIEAGSCLRLAERETDPVVKVLLRSMARSWLGLADQAPLAVPGNDRIDLSMHVARC